ncbi:MAG: glycine cleavage system aminomethyltransferase GcvT [Alphaproteobacteria bacterium]|nr:glycine cleavage system aminomethyltransferase GcvT [Alphaproteobacteria bacterium]
MSDDPGIELKRTALTAWHERQPGVRFAAFAGYNMPIQYAAGIMAEHTWTRAHAGLFDVAHMGPSFLRLPASKLGNGEAAHREVAAEFERLVCGDIVGLKPGENRYTLLLADDGGILDDLMVARPFGPDRQGELYIVVNSGGKEFDFSRISQMCPGAQLDRADERHCLMALQGPEAATALVEAFPAAADDIASMSFMTYRAVAVGRDARVHMTRSGYTGEDGFEILVPAQDAEGFADRLCETGRVKPIGLGARDSLRLEAGLCLYGHDIDAHVSPIGASLAWTVSKGRRERADFPGAERILRELETGPTRRRVGIRPLGRAPAREGAEI